MRVRVQPSIVSLDQNLRVELVNDSDDAMVWADQQLPYAILERRGGEWVTTATPAVPTPGEPFAELYKGTLRFSLEPSLEEWVTEPGIYLFAFAVTVYRIYPGSGSDDSYPLALVDDFRVSRRL